MDNSTRFIKALGIALLGALVGGAIYFAVSYFLKISSVFFFLLNGLGAYAFWEVFMPKDEQRKIHLISVIIADILSVFITLFCIYTLSPLYAAQGSDLEWGVWKRYAFYMFSTGSNGMSGNFIWILGIIFSILGTFLAILLYRIFDSGKKKKKNKNKNKKR